MNAPVPALPPDLLLANVRELCRQSEADLAAARRTLAAGAAKLCKRGGRAYSPAGWKLLSFVGHQVDPEFELELRNCQCGSTLAIELPRGGAR